MAGTLPDPYATLGVSADASDAELRAAYRRLVQLHHPDHNGGSAESEQRFEEIQAAYSRIRELRASGREATGGRRAAGSGQGAPPRAAPGSGIEARLAEMEAELRAARAARERARRAAEEAVRAARAQAARTGERPSDEELGIYSTDDSFTKILSDAASEFADRVSDVAGVAEHHVPKKLSDLIDELGSKLSGEPPER